MTWSLYSCLELPLPAAQARTDVEALPGYSSAAGSSPITCFPSLPTYGSVSLQHWGIYHGSDTHTHIAALLCNTAQQRLLPRL